EAHVAALDGALPAPPAPPSGAYGKAIVYARRDVVMADTRPWLGRDDVRDLPFPGERIRRGRPVCTVFARAPDARGCYAGLVAAVLVRARLPLVYGLVEATVEAQRLAVEVADLTGGAADAVASAGHEPSFLAFQRIGQITATLGEVRERADLVVYWGIDPDAREPGFRDRYLAPSPDSPARARIAVDLGDARGPEEADERIAIPAAAEFEALWALRALVRGRRVDEERLGSLGVPADRLRPLAR